VKNTAPYKQTLNT